MNPPRIGHRRPRLPAASLPGTTDDAERLPPSSERAARSVVPALPAEVQMTAIRGSPREDRSQTTRGACRR
jgi:hypothetical protein